MLKKAEAWREYREAAMVDMLLETLPKVNKHKTILSEQKCFNFYFVFKQIAAEVAAPLSQAKKITMVSTGGGEIGAAKLTEEILTIVNKVPELVKSITGVDISRVSQNSKYI